MDQTPRSEQFNDVYFSAHDGPGETCHVFFDGNGLSPRWQGLTGRFTVAETGFGTGLNFLLAWEMFDRLATPCAFLDFISVEKFPLSAEEIRKGLSPWSDRLEPYLSKMLEQYPIRVPGFHRMVFDNRIALTLVFDDANDALPEVGAQVDAWFLDGFTPSKNPDMWTDKVLGEMARLSHGETTFSTFTAAGFVKRGLQAAGFHVEKRKGFGPKRDMLAGYYKGAEKRRAAACTKKVLIHGAGLAGCSAAYVLKQYGFAPVLFDPNGIASGASGNPVGLINPRLSAYRTPESDFYTAAFAQTARTFPQFEGVDYMRCGALHLVTDDEKQKRFSRTIELWRWHHDHMQNLDRWRASEIAGVKLEQDALYLPDSARIHPKALCEFYARDIESVDAPVAADAQIMACGAAVSGLPIHTVRGQITEIAATPESENLKTNLSYGGYVSTAVGGRHVVGSTFQKWLSETNIRIEDDRDNLEKLAHILPDLKEARVTGHRAALRTSSRDRFPVVGVMKEGTFVSTAHGSHGISTTLAAAHLLADLLRGGPLSLGKSTVNLLCPSRFSRGKAQNAMKNSSFTNDRDVRMKE